MKIGDTNFLEPHELVNQKDPGYFGKGYVLSRPRNYHLRNSIYFTQWPSYSAIYSGQDRCLLLSWVCGPLLLVTLLTR